MCVEVRSGYLPRTAVHASVMTRSHLNTVHTVHIIESIVLWNMIWDTLRICLVGKMRRVGLSKRVLFDVALVLNAAEVHRLSPS